MRLAFRLTSACTMYAVVWVLLVLVVLQGPFPKGVVSVTGVVPSGMDVPQAAATQQALPLEQLVGYIKGVLHGDLGLTLRGEPVHEILGRVWPRSFALVGLSLTLGIVIGMGLTMLLRTGPGWLQKMWYSVTFMGTGFPESMVTGFLWLGGVWLLTNWGLKPFPLLWITDFSWRHFVVPAMAMAVFPIGYVSTVVKSVLDELEQQPFFRVAYSKGLTRRSILFRHLLRHVVYRLSSVLPTLVPWIFSGLIITEWIFLIPGLGRAIGFMLYTGRIDAVLLAGIITILLGTALLVHVTTVLVGLMVDPRVREEG